MSLNKLSLIFVFLYKNYIWKLMLEFLAIKLILQFLFLFFFYYIKLIKILICCKPCFLFYMTLWILNNNNNNRNSLIRRFSWLHENSIGWSALPLLNINLCFQDRLLFVMIYFRNYDRGKISGLIFLEARDFTNKDQVGKGCR